MNETKFYASIRASLFAGTISTEQFGGIRDILEGWKQYGTKDRRHLAYVLATAYHETGKRMIAVREGQGRRKAWTDAQARNAVALLFRKGRIKRNYALPGSFGNSYYGRGLVQITHEANYKKMGDILGIDLVRHPDLALGSSVSVRILIEGSLRGVSTRGDFTSTSLEDHIHDDVCNYVTARRVINGNDVAVKIAGHAEHFEKALRDAEYAHVPFSDKKEAAVPAKPTDAKQESIKPGVKQLQEIQKQLARLGYHEVGKVDGLWGEKTESALIAFRRAHGLSPEPIVDIDFLSSLWIASPRYVEPDRKNATLPELKGTVPGAIEADVLQKVGKVIGLGGVIAGGTLTLEDITGLADKAKAIQELVAVIPSAPTFLLVGGIGIGAWVLANRFGGKLVNLYRTGRLA